MDVEASPDGRHGTEPDSLARAVGQSVAEVRRRNALVIAWVRLVLLGATFGLYLYAHLGLGDPRIALILPTTGAHLGLAALAAWLLVRRWRTTEVTLAAAILDAGAVLFGGLVIIHPGGDHAVWTVAFCGGVMQMILLFAAVALPARLTTPLAAGMLALQVLLALQARLSAVELALQLFTASAFAFVVIWVGIRMVKLTAGLAVTQAAAALAEQHAHALEAAHAEMAAQRDRLVSAQNEAEALAQVIVHDLKNPLATLLQYVALAETELKGVPAAAGLVDYLEHASDEGRRLSKLIGDLLLVYRLERGVMAPVREPVPMKLLLQSVARRFTHRAGEREVGIELDAGEDLVVAADLDLAQRMLENLLSNALRHVGRGDRVRMDAREVEGEIRIAVRNSGPPVSHEIRGRLFDRFVTAGRREWQNAGLGLYLCRLVAEAHGGSIALVDAPGWNVSFEVVLPVSPPVTAEGSQPAARVGGA